MIDLNSYKYLVTTVEEGSISQASKKLLITSNTLRKEIENLEYELGYNVLLRTNKGVRLTQKGYDVYEKAKLIVEQANIIETSLLGGNKLQRKIKLASFASHAISEQFFKLCASECEDSELCFYECGTKDSVLKLTQNEVELAFIYFCDDQSEQFREYIDGYDIDFMKMFSGELCVGVMEKSSLYFEDEVDVKQLQDKTLIIRSYDYHNFLGIHQELNKIGINPKKTMVLDGNNYYAALKAIDSFTICPIWSKTKIQNKKLKTLRIKDRNIITNFGYIKKRNVILSDNINNLVDNLIEKYT